MFAIKKHILAWGLALSLLLTGCASLLERSYSASNPHVDRPTVAEDPSVLRVENYRELVSAVLYLVSQGVEEGVIQLHDYTGTVEADLNGACAEVAKEDPLGAYCVDYIKHEYIRVVSDYQATLEICYRRTPEQVRSMVNVTGTGAIRTELQEALAQFADQVVLRVAYFSEDEASIEALVRQAYYDTPAAALGLPQVEISLYPDSGRERVVEISLTYPEGAEELRRKGEALSQVLKELPIPGQTGTAPVFLGTPEERARQSLELLWTVAVYAPDGGSTTYDALVAGVADGEGMALGYALLAEAAGIKSQVVEGERNGLPHFWIGLELEEEERYLDPSEGTGSLRTAQELSGAGYRWRDGPEEPETGLGTEGRAGVGRTLEKERKIQ